MQRSSKLLIGAITGLSIALFVALASAANALADGASEITCLALTIYHEARGESLSGRRAVGHVVMNRAGSPEFPSKVCDVVRQGGETLHQCQFSWWCDGLSDEPREHAVFRDSLSLAEEIYRGCDADPTGGALWFHTTAVRPSWSTEFGRPRQIGAHLFYRGPVAEPRPIHVSAKASDAADECGRSRPFPEDTRVAAG